LWRRQQRSLAMQAASSTAPKGPTSGIAGTTGTTRGDRGGDNGGDNGADVDEEAGWKRGLFPGARVAIDRGQSLGNIKERDGSFSDGALSTVTPGTDNHPERYSQHTGGSSGVVSLNYASMEAITTDDNGYVAESMNPMLAIAANSAVAPQARDRISVSTLGYSRGDLGVGVGVGSAPAAPAAPAVGSGATGSGIGISSLFGSGSAAAAAGAKAGAALKGAGLKGKAKPRGGGGTA
jgi:hypothetical protein